MSLSFEPFEFVGWRTLGPAVESRSPLRASAFFRESRRTHPVFRHPFIFPKLDFFRS